MTGLFLTDDKMHTKAHAIEVVLNEYKPLNAVEALLLGITFQDVFNQFELLAKNIKKALEQ